MANRSRASERRLRAMARAAYCAAEGEEGSWDAALAAVADSVAASAATLVVFDVETGAGALPFRFNMSDATDRAYRDHFWSCDIWRTASEVRDVRAGDGYLSEALVADTEFLASEFYNDYLRPNGIRYWCGGLLGGDMRSGGSLGLMRGPRARPFEEADLAPLRWGLRCLGMALETRRRVGALEGQWTGLAEVLAASEVGLLLLDPGGRVVGGNLLGENVLRDGRALAARPSRLTARHPAAENALTARLDAVRQGLPASPAPFHIPGPDGFGYAVRVLTAPTRGPFAAVDGRCTIVVIEPAARPDVEMAVADATDRYRLTPAEARLLAELVRGRSLDQARERLGTSRHTVRNQLKSIFWKSGTTRQAQLVASVLGADRR